jgi:hypothetical protein
MIFLARGFLRHVFESVQYPRCLLRSIRRNAKLGTIWPEITDEMAANSISYAHNELILRNQDGGYYTVFYYRQYKIDAHNEI